LEHLKPGLCATCRHAREIVSARGSRFLLCQLALTNPAYSKYPRLPVRRCAGYQQKEQPAP
jgi:hypothetical protein